MRYVNRQTLAVTLVGAAALALAGFQATAPATKAPSLAGTWKLVKRANAGATTDVKYKDVVGLLTFTDKYRNFNVSWTDAAGKHFSLSIISEYTLNAKEYSEKNLYMMSNDEINGGSVTYGKGKSGTAPVKWDGTILEIPMPLFTEPVLVMEGNTITATRSGDFIDTWEKVK